MQIIVAVFIFPAITALVFFICIKINYVIVRMDLMCAGESANADASSSFILVTMICIMNQLAHRC